MDEKRPQNSRLQVMGILNVTPDSFSDGGKYNQSDVAIARAEQLIAQGADILDIGAESTRPGYTPLDTDTEWSRLEPILGRLCAHTDVPISVDTYHAATADRAIQSGVKIINDISACRDPEMAKVLARAPEVEYVFMHNRSVIQPELNVACFIEETKRGIERLLDAGVHRDRIIVDPGVGFAKTQSQNLGCIRQVDRFVQLGYRVLLGTSRKRVIGNVLSLPVDERVEGTLATTAHALYCGVSIVRVHDVQETVRFCRMLEAIRGGEPTVS